MKNEELKYYWITFPGKMYGPIGIGVTAFSEMDALELIQKTGYLEISGERQIKTISSVEELDQKHVALNMGPIVFRGVWYPCLNIGIGASGQ